MAEQGNGKERKAATLLDHVEALAVVDEWFDEHMPEITAAEGEVPEALAQLLDLTTADFNEKAERVALKINQLVAESAAIQQEADRLARRAKTRKARADYLKRYLHLCLTKAKVQKVNGLLATVRIQKNSQPSVRSTLTVDQLEAWYGAQFTDDKPIIVAKVVEFKLEARRVIEAVRAGQPIPDGITIEHGTHVRID